MLPGVIQESTLFPGGARLPRHRASQLDGGTGYWLRRTLNTQSTGENVRGIPFGEMVGGFGMSPLGLEYVLPAADCNIDGGHSFDTIR